MKEYETECECGAVVGVVFRPDFDGNYTYFIDYHYAAAPEFSAFGTCSESGNEAINGVREVKGDE